MRLAPHGLIFSKPMACRKVGQQDYLGAVRGTGYFVKYCPCCREKIYLEGDYELSEFLAAVPRHSVLTKLQLFVKSRVRIPTIRVEWKTAVEKELETMNKRIEYANAITRSESMALVDTKKFNRNFFDEKYSVSGGVAALESLIARKAQPHEIAQHFGFSKQRAQQISIAYRQKLAV